MRNFGSFTINGGTITGNTAEKGGGVRNDGTLIMNAGEIANNTATSQGGGVQNYAGNFTLAGGKICGNKALASDASAQALGGGVENSGTVTMSGGEISENSASNDGGGVRNATNGTFNLLGGTISGNMSKYGDGVYCHGNATTAGVFTMSGAACIASDNHVYLNTGAVITIAGTLTAPAPVAIVRPASYTAGTPLLAAATNSDGNVLVTLAAEAGKFALTSASSWRIADNGTLVQQ